MFLLDFYGREKQADSCKHPLNMWIDVDYIRKKWKHHMMSN